MCHSPPLASLLSKAYTLRLAPSPLRPMEEFPEAADYARSLKALVAETS
jgi:hypothetical protein